jgi:hypothetical protein
VLFDLGVEAKGTIMTSALLISTSGLSRKVISAAAVPVVRAREVEVDE